MAHIDYYFEINWIFVTLILLYQDLMYQIMNIEMMYKLMIDIEKNNEKNKKKRKNYII